MSKDKKHGHGCGCHGHGKQGHDCGCHGHGKHGHSDECNPCAHQRPVKFAIAGNPNAGKTTLFNALTGASARVGNWPGVTVDRKEGVYKRHGIKAGIIDLPGVYSLSPYTPEEVIARDYIIHGDADLIINIVDATNIERNLYLTTQLMEMDKPVVVALNMMDLAEKAGIQIDARRLEADLGVPVVPICAVKKRGINALMQEACKAVRAQRKGTSVLEDSEFCCALKDLEKLVSERGFEHTKFHAVKLLEGDALESKAFKDFAKAEEIRKQVKLSEEFDDDFEAAVANERYRQIERRFTHGVKRTADPAALTPSDRIDRVLTSRIFGLPIFFALMFFVFHVTFSEDLFFLESVGVLGGGEEVAEQVEAVEAPETPDAPQVAESATPEQSEEEAEEEGGGILSPGVWMLEQTGVLMEFISETVDGWMEEAEAPDWARSLVIDGVLAGLGAVLSFLPQILMLFLFLSILEDSGYMARAAFLMDRILRRFGLSGKAFMPMLMCFGCLVPAIMGSRTLENERERRLMIMLAPFFSCGAKLPIWAMFSMAIFPGSADLVIFAIYMLGIVTAVVAALILKHTILKGEATPFVMELPPYHRPTLKNVVRTLWEKLRGFVIRATTIIAGATVVIWFLSSFNFSLEMVDANSQESILGAIGGWIQPLFEPLGWASGDIGWKAVVAALTGLIAKEMVVSTMGVLYNPDVDGDALEDGGASAALALSLVAVFSPVAAVSFMAFNLLSVPCMAAVATAHAELRSAKWTWITIFFWIATAWIVSFLIYQVGSRIFG